MPRINITSIKDTPTTSRDINGNPVDVIEYRVDFTSQDLLTQLNRLEDNDDRGVPYYLSQEFSFVWMNNSTPASVKILDLKDHDLTSTRAEVAQALRAAFSLQPNTSALYMTTMINPNHNGISADKMVYIFKGHDESEHYYCYARTAEREHGICNKQQKHEESLSIIKDVIKSMSAPLPHEPEISQLFGGTPPAEQWDVTVTANVPLAGVAFADLPVEMI